MDIEYWKKKMPWITRGLFLLGLGIFLILIGNAFSLTDEKTVKNTPEATQTADTLVAMEKEISMRLETTLKQIDGVGDVSVTVFLATGPKFNYAVNSAATRRTVEEKDKSGSNRLTAENNVNDQMVILREGNASSEKPVLLNEEQPQVQGVLVVADGASSSYIKREITGLIANLLNIPEYKVTVEPRKGGIFLDSNKR